MNPMFKLIISAVFTCLFTFNTFGASIAGGDTFSLALKDDGTVWGWGHNYYGELTGTDVEFHTPVQASGLTGVISISAGSFHSLALKSNGTVWSFGKNDYGQLGDGTDEQRNTPVQVVGLSGIIAINTHPAGYHSLALKNDGAIWAWGGNWLGALGDGTTIHRNIPVQVVGLSAAIAVSAGGNHSLALKRDGTVWAWGGNTNNLTAVQVSGLTDVISISAGDGHSLALKRDGTVWAWGNNYYGQLGDGNSQPYSLIPVQSLVSGVIAIGSGRDYSLALASYGTVWFYGFMEIDIGTGDSISSIIPVPVDGVSSVKAIAGGYYHTLVVKNDGTVWAWGYNYFGELGDGTTHKRRYPVQVKGFSLAASSAPASVLAADFDGDGRADPIAVQAPSTDSTSSLQASSGQAVNAWYFWYSSQSFSREGPIALGLTGTPAAGDVDGDGRGDMALVSTSGDPSTGSGQVWYFWLSSRGYALSESVALGVSGSPVLADFDGDGKADPTIVTSGNPSTGSGQVWYVWLSAAGYSKVSASFAVAGGTPLAADFDGDGRADPVMVSANGGWYFWLSGSWYIRAGPYYFGLTGKPVAGDFDGDGEADPAMMDSSGNWYFWLSGSFYIRDGPYYLVLP